MGRPQIFGAALGAVIGVVFVWQGALDAFFTALFIFGGWLAGKYAAGGMPAVDDMLERFVSNRNRDRGR